MLKPLSRQRGVSIIEILIGLAIAALVLGFAAPTAGVWIQNTQLRNAAESILNGVQTARLEALKRNVPVALQLTDANSTAWRVCIYDAPSDACSTTQAAIQTKSANEGGMNARAAAETALTAVAGALAAGSGLPAKVVFDPFGRLFTGAPNNLVRVDVRNTTLSTDEERRLVILLSAGGQVRMCDPKLSQATNPQGCA